MGSLDGAVDIDVSGQVRQFCLEHGVHHAQLVRDVFDRGGGLDVFLQGIGDCLSAGAGLAILF